MFKKIICFLFVISFFSFSNEVRLKEISRIEGVRNNQLIGMGLVIGPNADNTPMMWGNYNGTPNHTVNILDRLS